MTNDNYKIGWGHQRGIISDRDARFIMGLMNKQHRAQGTKFFTTAAYHPEADGQSERTNQTVEIASRYFVTENPKADWTDALPHLQFILNTSVNASTQVSPAEYVFGFNPYSGIDLLEQSESLTKQEYEELRLQYREKAEEAIQFARVRQKHRHDRHHRTLQLQPGDKVFLRLHHGYKLMGNMNRKLDRQRDGPMEVLERIGKNAYRIKIPAGMKIHDVVNVQQLIPLPPGDDPYGRKYPPRDRAITADRADKHFQHIDFFVNDKTGTFEYLVKWTDQPHSHNAWVPVAALGQAKDLRKNFDAEFPVTAEEKRTQRRIQARLQRKKAKDARPHQEEPESSTESEKEPPKRPKRARKTALVDSPQEESPPAQRRQPPPSRGMNPPQRVAPAPSEETHTHQDEEQNIPSEPAPRGMTLRSRRIPGRDA